MGALESVLAQVEIEMLKLVSPEDKVRVAERAIKNILNELTKQTGLRVTKIDLTHNGLAFSSVFAVILRLWYPNE